jgi:hypothetical protein
MANPNDGTIVGACLGILDNLIMVEEACDATGAAAIKAAHRSEVLRLARAQIAALDDPLYSERMTSEQMRRRASTLCGTGRQGTVLGAEVQGAWFALASVQDQIDALAKRMGEHQHPTLGVPVEGMSHTGRATE